MRIRRNFIKGGYSADIFKEYLGSYQPVLAKGQGVEKQYKFVNNKPTDEVTNLRIGVYFKGAGYVSVKLPKSFKLNDQIKDLSPVSLIDGEACIVRRNIYVRCKDIRPAK